MDAVGIYAYDDGFQCLPFGIFIGPAAEARSKQEAENYKHDSGADERCWTCAVEQS